MEELSETRLAEMKETPLHITARKESDPNEFKKVLDRTVNIDARNLQQETAENILIARRAELEKEFKRPRQPTDPDYLSWLNEDEDDLIMLHNIAQEIKNVTTLISILLDERNRRIKLGKS